MNKENFVRDIVQNILDKDQLNTTEITGITIQDHGNCIHVKFKGGVALSTISAIGLAFGDDNPNIYSAEGENIYIVMSNEKFDELIG